MYKHVLQIPPSFVGKHRFQDHLVSTVEDSPMFVYNFYDLIRMGIVSSYIYGSLFLHSGFPIFQKCLSVIISCTF